MRLLFRILPVIAVSASIGACSSAVEDDGLGKDEARAHGGKTDDGYDFCEIYGWYGDGVCDVFCTDTDPDCIEYCYSDGDCESHERCNAADVCLSPPCPDGMACPAVCAGECVPDPGEFCGGFLGATCDEGEFCDYDPDQTCGFADGGGVCKARPDACFAIYAPVCACDGNTYENGCKANAAGFSVKSQGPCGAPEPVASCAGNCGTYAPDMACYCDAACAGYGDCCDDYEAVCPD